MKMRVLLTMCARLACALAQDDDPSGESTDISDMLNAAIAGSGGAYTAGRGVLVRAPDFFQGDTEVVPATFWSNDIFTPSPLFPATGDPRCPSSGDGWSDLVMDCSAGSPWDRATVAVVISSSMSNLMEDWDNIQDADWGWGVFYPFDSNSADKRCIWRDDWGGYDCPGGFIDGDGVFTVDSSKKGPGSYPAGNPWSGNVDGGGGVGCHFDGGAIDQMDADGMNLVQDSHCQCNYAFSDDWNNWVQQWMSQGTQKPGYEWRGWFWNGKAPMWAVDTSICWVNNIRDMIALQNALYGNAETWSNQLMPQSNWGQWESDQDRIYWGWNEIPVTMSAAEDPANWDSVIIKLPADICGNGDDNNDIVWCLGEEQRNDLLTQLKQFESAGRLLKGLNHVTDRPGSYILFVREYRVEWGWERFFFCRHGVFEDREIKHEHGACFYDDGDEGLKNPSIDVI